jgi:hypothetical protein
LSKDAEYQLETSKASALLYSIPEYLAGGALLLVADYSIYENFAKQVSPLILEVVYNAVINL